MKKHTIEITTYSYDELSDEAKQKTRDEYRQHGLNYGWWDYTYDSAKECGIKITSFDVYRRDLDFELIPGNDLQDYAKKFLESAKDWTDAKGKTGLTLHKADCENYLNDIEAIKAKVDAIEDDNERYEAGLDSDDKILELESDFKRDISHYWLRTLENEEEYLTSDEQIEETIRCNEHEFLENGEIA